MKLIIDERVKHRIIGLAVILSIGAIFAPAIMKKSNQRFDSNVSVSVELPPKPEQPKIALTEKKEMFETIKVAHVEIPDESDGQLPQSLPKSTPNNAKQVQSLKLAASSVVNRMELPTTIAKNNSNLLSATKVAAIKKVAKAAILPTNMKPKAIAKNNRAVKPLTKRVVRNGYAVQLATFSKQSNADSLVAKLRKNGYIATANKIKTNTGVAYKVLVGQVDKKEQALALQKKLASIVQINGFIVSTSQG